MTDIIRSTLTHITEPVRVKSTVAHM